MQYNLYIFHPYFSRIKTTLKIIMKFNLIYVTIFNFILVIGESRAVMLEDLSPGEL